MIRAILLLGSNLGNRLQYLKDAVRHLSELENTSIINKSSVYESEAVGYNSEQSYYNAAVEIKTMFSPQEILKNCLAIEQQLERTRSETVRYIDRTIDIDIILIEQNIIEKENLIVPHPRMEERLFCLKPLAEIAGDYIVPTKNETVTSLLEKIEHKNEVIIVDVKL